MKMMQQVVAFYPSQKLALVVHAKVLHAMAQFVHHKTRQAGRKG
jgi:hypothetical protein